MTKLAMLGIASLILGPLPAISAENASTTPYAPLPHPVTSFGAATDRGWLYVYGGHLGETHEYSSNEVSGACRRLNLKNGSKWQDLPSGIPAQGPGLVAHDGWLYRIGGMAARNAKGQKRELHSHATVHRLRLYATGTVGRVWREFEPLPSARSSHDAVVVGDKLFVAGGWTVSGTNAPSQWHDTALILNLSHRRPKWESIPQPFKRRAICMAALDARVFCIGGMTDSDSTSLAVDVYDTATGLWSQGPSLPTGKLKGFGNAACVVDGRLHVSGLSGTVWRLNDTRDGWEEFAKLHTSRFFHRLVPGIDGRLVAIAGQGENEKLRDIEIVLRTP